MQTHKPIECLPRLCSVIGCGGLYHAKNMCRLHYCRLWDQTKRDRSKPIVRRHVDGRTELNKAREAYDCAVGLEAKIRWRRTIDALEGVTG